jgi:hypothetical protein
MKKAAPLEVDLRCSNPWLWVLGLSQPIGLNATRRS